MTNRVGLWIDHEKAVIVSVSEKGETVRKIESGAKHAEYRGAQRSKVPYSAQYSQGDDQLDKRFQQQLAKYYDAIAEQLKGATAVLIFGPGEARSELKRHLDARKGAQREILVEAADRMTDRQIVARVREYSKPGPGAG
ncbi:MAG TPA: hypothetical protein VIU38_08635 [Anaerolineales bacterium]